MINRIIIKNVKGYGSQGKNLNVNFDPTKINQGQALDVSTVS